MVPIRTSQAAQQQNKLMQFLVCANFGLLFSFEILPQASEDHIKTRFSLFTNFAFGVLHSRNAMSCQVSVHRVLSN